MERISSASTCCPPCKSSKQPRDCLQVNSPTLARFKPGERIGLRDPHVSSIGERETGRHDSANLVALPIESQRRSDDSGIGSELTLPQTVAQNHYLSASRLVILRSEGPAERRLYAHHREETDRNLRGQQPDGLTPPPVSTKDP